MRILTVRQPWAWAIIHGGKDVENRVRNIAGDYRGPVLIHTALKRDDQGWVDSGAWRLTTSMRGEPMALGAIIGVVDLVDVHHDMSCPWEPGRRGYRAGQCSPWAEPNAFHLVFANPRALDEPIPYKGALGLRHLDDDTTARILAQIQS